MKEPTDPWAKHRPTLPPCPQCKSTAKRCHRPSGHDAPQWHAVREDIAAEACGCDGCKNWLKVRAMEKTDNVARGIGRQLNMKDLFEGQGALTL